MPPPSPTSSPARPSNSRPRRSTTIKPRSTSSSGRRPRADDAALDVACGPGSVVCAFAPHVRRAEGLDATEAMLAEARRLTMERGLANVAWHWGDAYALPFADAAFDIVSCRYAFHHL